MRIAYEYMLPGACDTGVEITIRELLRALTRLWTDSVFDVYTYKGAASSLPQSPNLRVKVSRLAGLGRACRIAWQQAAAPALLGFTGTDVYHATGYSVSPLLRIPTVVSVYDTIALERPGLTRVENAIHYRLTVRSGVRSAARVIVPSVHVKNRLIELAGIPPEKVEVVHLGVSSRFRPEPKDAARNRLTAYPALAGRKFVLSVGNLEHKKNTPTLLAAFAALPRDIREGMALVFVGKPGSDSRRLRRSVSRANLEDDVFFTGYVQDDVLAALYGAAEMLVYPSLDEGFGLPPLEAMACGTPVIASKAGALPETVGQAALLVQPQDAGALAAAISLILKSPQKVAELRLIGLKHASGFTWEACARRVMGVYEAVRAESHQRMAVTEERRHERNE